jgi:hypothetical protein
LKGELLAYGRQFAPGRLRPPKPSQPLAVPEDDRGLVVVVDPELDVVACVSRRVVDEVEDSGDGEVELPVVSGVVAPAGAVAPFVVSLLGVWVFFVACPFWRLSLARDRFTQRLILVS